jgi:hypothetical protein
MQHIRFTLFADGSTDRALLPVLRWLIRETHHPDTISPEFLFRPQFRADLTLADRLKATLTIAPCDILFIHRDAEKQASQRRYEEIASAVMALGEQHMMVPHVCVVPVRMTEAWLLIDELAIRRAAGRPQSTDPLDLPKLIDLFLFHDTACGSEIAPHPRSLSRRERDETTLLPPGEGPGMREILS